MTSGKFPPLIRNSDNHVIHWSNIILIISKMIADCHHSWSRSLGRPGVTGKTGRLAPNGSVPFYGESTSDQGWRFRLRAAGTPLVMVWGGRRRISRLPLLSLKDKVFYEVDIGISLASTFLHKLQGSQLHRKLLGKQEGWCLMGSAYNYLMHPFLPCGVSASCTRRVGFGIRTTLSLVVLTCPLPTFASLTLPMPSIPKHQCLTNSFSHGHSLSLNVFKSFIKTGSSQVSIRCGCILGYPLHMLSGKKAISFQSHSWGRPIVALPY